MSFPSGISLGGGKDILFRGNTTGCPRCGGPADIADAVVDAVGTTHVYVGHMGGWRALREARLDLADVREIRDLARRVRKGTLSDDAALAALERNPRLKRFRELQGSPRGSDWWVKTQTIATILALVWSVFAYFVPRRQETLGDRSPPPATQLRDPEVKNPDESGDGKEQPRRTDSRSADFLGARDGVQMHKKKRRKRKRF